MTKRKLKRDYKALKFAYDLDQEEHAREQKRMSDQTSQMMKRDRENCETIRSLRAKNERLCSKLQTIKSIVGGQSG